MKRLWMTCMALVAGLAATACVAQDNQEGVVRLTDSVQAGAAAAYEGAVVQHIQLTGCEAGNCGNGSCSPAACGANSGECGSSCGNGGCGCGNSSCSCGKRPCIAGLGSLHKLCDADSLFGHGGSDCVKCQDPACRCNQVGLLNKLFADKTCEISDCDHNGGWCSKCGKDCACAGRYRIVYAADPHYFDKRDGQLYSAQGYGVPVAVPLAPNVRQAYNYGWGIPSSRITPISQPLY